jgi:hypothetical protein
VQKFVCQLNRDAKIVWKRTIKVFYRFLLEFCSGFLRERLYERFGLSWEIGLSFLIPFLGFFGEIFRYNASFLVCKDGDQSLHIENARLNLFCDYSSDCGWMGFQIVT